MSTDIIVYPLKNRLLILFDSITSVKDKKDLNLLKELVKEKESMENVRHEIDKSY
ncbi:MAG: hypothetical protein ACI9V9_000472 [Oleispira sp.]